MFDENNRYVNKSESEMEESKQVSTGQANPTSTAKPIFASEKDSIE